MAIDKALERYISTGEGIIVKKPVQKTEKQDQKTEKPSNKNIKKESDLNALP